MRFAASGLSPVDNGRSFFFFFLTCRDSFYKNDLKLDRLGPPSYVIYL